MNYKERLLGMRQAKIAGTIAKAEQEQKLRHEIAMDTLAAERGLNGLSEKDRSIVEAATIEILVADTILNTLPKGKRDTMVKQAMRKAMDTTASDLKHVVRQIVNFEESQLSKKGNYTALRAGGKMTFGYYGHCYVEIDMKTRTFSLVKVPVYATARRMVRYLAELCDVTLADMQIQSHKFEVIHEIHS